MPLVHLKTKRLEYKFEITQKYNLIIGDSGNGKTTLVNTLHSLLEESYSGTLDGYKKIKTSRDLRIKDLEDLENYIFFIDEFSKLLSLPDIASIMENSHNYFVIISRDETLGFKSISLDCVYIMHTSGKFHDLKKAYSIPEKMFKVSRIICEDSRSGYQFMQERFENLAKVDYAKASLDDKTGGKSKFAEYIETLNDDEFLCLVFDRSAIGYDYHKILNNIEKKKMKVCIIDWDSFECYILQSTMFNKKVPEPMNEYESKEKLATSMLSDLIAYKKESLTKCFKKNFCKECTGNSCNYRYVKEDDRLVYWKVDWLMKEFEHSTNNAVPVNAF